MDKQRIEELALKIASNPNGYTADSVELSIRVPDMFTNSADPALVAAVSESLQRMIESTMILGDASYEDAITVAHNRPLVLRYGPHSASNLEILRRIVERGLSKAQAENSKYVDIFQHMLDEIQRVNLLITE